eukprot:15001-Heterococcus_DN1.PRE.2
MRMVQKRRCAHRYCAAFVSGSSRHGENSRSHSSKNSPQFKQTTHGLPENTSFYIILKLQYHEIVDSSSTPLFVLVLEHILQHSSVSCAFVSTQRHTTHRAYQYRLSAAATHCYRHTPYCQAVGHPVKTKTLREYLAHTIHTYTHTRSYCTIYYSDETGALWGGIINLKKPSTAST